MKKDQEPLTLMKLRENVGLTQRQLAQALNVTISTVSSWENGRHEPRLTLAQTKLLTEVLMCSLDDLVTATQKRTLSQT